MLVTMNGCGFCGKTCRLESSSTLNPSVSWGAGHHNQGSGSGTWGPSHNTIAHGNVHRHRPTWTHQSWTSCSRCVSEQGTQSVAMMRDIREISIWWLEIRIFFRKQKVSELLVEFPSAPREWSDAGKSAGCPRQESETLWVMLQIPYGVPMRVAYSYVFELTMRCLLGDDQYAS